MLVADAFDAMGAEAVEQQRGALQRFAGGDLAGRELFLQVVAAGDGACRAGGQRHAAIAIIRPHDLVEHFVHRLTGDVVMPQVVAELLELVEDDQVFARGAQLPALVENLLDVALGAGGLDDLARHLGQPREPLLAHPFRQNGDRFTGQQIGVISAAATVVAGGGPDRLLRGRVELASDQSRHETAKRRTDFVGSGREPFANQDDDARLGAGQFRRELQVVDATILATAGRWLIVPGNAKQIQRVQIPQTDIIQLVGDALRHQFRLALLLKRRDDDVTFAGALDSMFQGCFIEGQINHVGSPEYRQISQLGPIRTGQNRSEDVRSSAWGRVVWDGCSPGSATL